MKNEFKMSAETIKVGDHVIFLKRCVPVVRKVGEILTVRWDATKGKTLRVHGSNVRKASAAEISRL